MSFLIFLFSTIGLTLIITTSFIFKNIRNKAKEINPILGKLFSCSQCAGFYVALLIQFIILIHDRMIFHFTWVDLYYILYGFIGSLVSYIVYLLIKPLIDKYD
jgi:hypothetical protein